MADIHPGSTVRITVAFLDAADLPIDPTNVKVKIKPIGGDLSTYVFGTDADVVKDSVGNYHIDWVVSSLTGSNQKFTYRWEGTGNLNAADEGEFMATTRFF